MLSLQELSVFLMVAELGSFSKAGRQLHLSQPAISQTIRSLEKRFETELFLRQGRNIHLTETGQALIPMARELLASARRIGETMASLDGEVVGEINIGCSTSSGKYLLLGLVARFRREFPQVRINILVGDRNRVRNWLLSGQVAVGVSSKYLEHHDLEHQPFFLDEIELIAPVDHPWAKYGRIYPDDLLDEPLILREEGSGTRETVMNSLRAFDITLDLLNISMVLGNAEAIEMAVAEKLGVAFISTLAAARGRDLGRVRHIDVQGMELEREILMIRNVKQPATRAQSELWEFIGKQKAFARIPVRA